MGKLYIEDTLNESKSLMERMGLISEESINKKKADMKAAIEAIEGKKNYVHTFCIITGQNPMADKSSNLVNRTGNSKLRSIMKAGHYAYIPVKGKYEHTEDSFIIFNIPLDNAKRIAGEVSQESFIYGRVEQENQDSAIFDLYVMNKQTGEYEYKETKDYYINGPQIITDKETGEKKEDYFTQVGDKKKGDKVKKFSVDFDYFKEGMEKFNNIIAEQIAKSEDYRKRVEEFQDKLIEEGKTGRYMYMNRSLIYGSLFSTLDEQQNGKQ